MIFGRLQKELDMQKKDFISTLNQALEHELAGVVRYTHYSFMVFGTNRIPIIEWLRAQAQESLMHAAEVGEMITTYEGKPSLQVGRLLESEKTSIKDILEESLEYEKQALNMYTELYRVNEGKDIILEEFSRKMMYAEEMHVAEVQKMLRT